VLAQDTATLVHEKPWQVLLLIITDYL